MFSRLTNCLSRLSFNYATRGVYRTPPMRCDPTASCTVHTMLSAVDLNMYLVAIKSLLMHHSGVRVVVHSDGTLTKRHESLLGQHVLGCRIVERDEADLVAKRELSEGSFLYRCRQMDVHYRRLIDTELHNTTPKRIIMDSDVVVLQRPGEVIEWIERGSQPMLLGQRPQCDSRPGDIDLSHAHVQKHFKVRLNEIAERASMAAEFEDGTTAGFYGCRGELSLERIERTIRACLDLGLPMHHWGGDQCVVIYLLSIAGGRRLDEGRYFNLWPKQAPLVPHAHVIHFLGSSRHYGGIYRRVAAKVIQEVSMERCRYVVDGQQASALSDLVVEATEAAIR